MRELICLLAMVLLSTAARADQYGEFRETVKNNDVESFRALIVTEEDMRSPVYNRGIAALALAVGFGSTDIVRDIFRRFPVYASENAPDALVLACSPNRQSREIIAQIIASGTSIDAENQAEQNCLYLAVLSADYEFFDYLIDAGASLDVKVKPDTILGYAEPVTIEVFLDS